MTNLTKKNRSRKHGDKNAKALGSFMNNPVYSKTIENLRNRTDVRLARNKKYYLTWTSKPGYMSKKIFDYYLVAIRKSKVTLTINKPAYVEMSMLGFSRVLMYNFHFDCIRNKYRKNTRILLTDTDSLIYEIKAKDIYKKEIVNFSNYSTKSKYYHDSNKLVVGMMKDETGGVTIKEFAGLNPKMYLSLADDSGGRKKQRASIKIQLKQ